MRHVDANRLQDPKKPAKLVGVAKPVVNDISYKQENQLGRFLRA